MSDRTPAERRADEASAEVRRLRAIANPSSQQRVRLAKALAEQEAAWRVVHEMRRRVSMSSGDLIPRTLRDDAGVRHLALAPNGAAAWWTPIACGDGICLPGSQTSEPVDCPDCIVYMEARP